MVDRLSCVRPAEISMSSLTQNSQYLRMLKSTAYHVGARFGTFSSFFQTITETGELSAEYCTLFPWRNDLLGRELRRLKALAEEPIIHGRIENFYANQASRNQYLLLSSAARRVLDFSQAPELFLVDALPGPFDAEPWDAMFLDRFDEKRLGIPCGIYFRRAFETHCYFEFVVAHELVHWAISAHSEGSIHRSSAIEEGVCDVLGLHLLDVTGCLAPDVLVNLLIYNRATKAPDDLWSTYWRFCKMAAAAVNELGLDWLTALAKSGREGLVSDSFFSDRPLVSPSQEKKESNSLLSYILAADATKSIPIDSYILLEAAVSLAPVSELRVEVLRAQRLLPETVFDTALADVYASGLIAQLDHGKLYQPFQTLPKNLRYSMIGST